MQTRAIENASSHDRPKHYLHATKAGCRHRCRPPSLKGGGRQAKAGLEEKFKIRAGLTPNYSFSRLTAVANRPVPLVDHTSFTLFCGTASNFGSYGYGLRPTYEKTSSSAARNTRPRSQRQCSFHIHVGGCDDQFLYCFVQTQKDGTFILLEETSASRRSSTTKPCGHGLNDGIEDLFETYLSFT